MYKKLVESAVDLGEPGFDQEFGYGRADALAAVAATGQLAGVTFTVDSTGDGADDDTTDGDCDNGSGVCTLRAAIEQANADLGGVIEFDISGSGPHTIQPATALPTITKPVFIDGFSQPGASAGTIRIELDGTNAGTSYGRPEDQPLPTATSAGSRSTASAGTASCWKPRAASSSKTT